MAFNGIAEAWGSVKETGTNLLEGAVSTAKAVADRAYVAGEELASHARTHLIDRQIPEELLAQWEEESIVRNYAPPAEFLGSSRGSLMRSADGKRTYVDGNGAYSANNNDNRNERATGSFHAGSVDSSVLSRARRSPELALLGREVQRIFGAQKMILPMNTGCEAIEGGALIGKLVFNKSEDFREKREKLEEEGIAPKLVVCNGNFHGRSEWAKAASDEEAYTKPFEPLAGEKNIKQIPFNDLDALEKTLKEGDVYAFAVEPIQGEGGIIVPDPAYLQGVRRLCDQYNVLMICDEVQTGLGRTGKRLAQDHSGVEADITSIGKAISSGVVPASFFMLDQKYGKLVKPGEHGSTFGGYPAACRTMRASLREMEDRDSCKLAEENGAWFMRQLKQLCDGCPGIKEVRGIGMMIGIELEDEGVATVCDRLRQSPFVYKGQKIEGFWTNAAHDKTIRISPPVTTDRGLLEAVLYSFAQALNHKNPEIYRAVKLEAAPGVLDVVDDVRDKLGYFMKRARRFASDYREARQLATEYENAA